jgi:hypothetical protein
MSFFHNATEEEVKSNLALVREKVLFLEAYFRVHQQIQNSIILNDVNARLKEANSRLGRAKNRLEKLQTRN